MYPSLDQHTKDQLKKNPNIFELLYGKGATTEVFKRKLEPWEVNQRCFHSITYKHKKKKGKRKKLTWAEVDKILEKIPEL